MADDFQTMKLRILDELTRTDLTSQAGLAINSAIAHYESERFWFNEARSTTNTVSGQEYYALPSDYIDTDVLSVVINNYSYVLPQRTHTQLEEWYVSNSSYTGYPRDHSIYEEQIRLYPIANGAYPLTLSYIKQLTSLSADADTNAWMTVGEGEELIRSRAEADMCARILQDLDRAAIYKALETETYSKLHGKTNKRLMRGRSRRHM